MTDQKILGLIPARGGSKGILRKNIKLIAGKPLIVWTIEAALKSKHLTSIVVSTDDPEIAEIAEQSGASVPFLRPAELATDYSSGIDPVLHALDNLPGFDYVMLLQPTSPLRTSVDIDDCVEFAISKNANSVVSVCEAQENPFWMFRLGDSFKMTKLLNVEDVARRQDSPKVFTLNGSIYLSEVNYFREKKKFITEDTLAYLMNKESSIDIDDMMDWKLAEILLLDKV
ncbi:MULTISPECIES: cytidylyltransferase domain-containing protein [Leptospira]|uniref:acylneuraminate cytidylyltransferase family protein n=1 Tax=Leptospira TaxID=171 RepID=UPI0002BF7B79|nr:MULTISPECIES: acylneuraminate cytidylyltransferase family protein [Leptospira]EMK10350.1 cytidylyltransferase [Leptospira kirschneri]KXZ27052.1 acylneuraminate cytidylyltransferase [Leptospira kirschneri]KXZ32938.1 acylneuraminate cytidylyltransferase [Leptospira sp. ZV016]